MTKKTKTILGIDPGFGRMGYAVVEQNGSNQTIREMGCIETDKETLYHKRLHQMGKNIAKIIQKNKPDSIALEKIFFSKNQKTALKIAEVRGLIIYISEEAKIPIYEFTPLEVKIAICGYGRADKKQVESMVKSLIKLESLPKYDDTTDAIAIAITAFAHTINFNASAS